MNGWMDGYMNGSMDAWEITGKETMYDEWMNGWMDAWLKTQNVDNDMRNGCNVIQSSTKVNQHGARKDPTLDSHKNFGVT